MSSMDQGTGDNALVQAAIQGDSGAVGDALEHGDANAHDAEGWTALHIAARNGNVEIARLLLAQPGIDVNVKNKWKSTPLMLAAGVGHLEVVELLLGHADTKVDLQAAYYGRTALIEAALNGHLDVVEKLVAHGADVNATDKTGRNSALIEAVKNDHGEVATYLLRSGLVDFSSRDLRLQALIWSGSRGGDVLRAELDAAINIFFRKNQRAAS